MPADYYTMSADELNRKLNTTEQGLSSDEAARRLKIYGYNELEKANKMTGIKIFLSQFTSPLMLLLVFAGLLSFFSKNYIEGIAIFCIVLLDAILGFFQEYRAEKAMEALEKVSAPEAKVMRDGKIKKIPAKEVVMGDVIILESGDIVPADARLVDSNSLQTDESSLTGESVPSEKFTLSCAKGAAITDQQNMVFSHTIVTYGSGKAVVVATGSAAEFGKIATIIKDTKDEVTPLQRKFEMLTKQIGFVVVLLVITVFLVGFFQDGMGFMTLLFFALALTVSTIPNSLPIIVTVGLSTGANRLAKKNLLVKKLSAAESLGAATIICTDKTGTLTKNQMTVTDIFIHGKNVEVSGTGYHIDGEFSCDSKPYDAADAKLLLSIGALCNNAVLTKKDDNFEMIGDPTEGALIVVARKAKLFESVLSDSYTKIHELPFDSDRKRMTVILKDNSHKSKKFLAFTKGAPDLLLAKCDKILDGKKVRKLTASDRKAILARNNSYAQDALRVLGFAYSEVEICKQGAAETTYTIANVERNMIFVGLAGMIDPPRDEVPAAIQKCRDAGIKVMMITGDQAITAKAIAMKIGLWDSNSIVLTGAELDKLSDVELQARIEDVRIVARALPIQKVRIVDALKKHGHIVAMTGDGVNDAPALKRADIGIAMGSGSDVAKEVAKGTLVDDNFSSIVNAIEEGRNIYDKILKSSRYLLSCNAGEITSILIAIVMSFPLPLLPLQLLLMNILTDDFPALGLGTEPADEGIMQRPPRDPSEKPINWQMLFSIAVFGIIMGLGTVFVFMKYKDIDLPHAQTMAFTTLVFIEMFAVMSSRSMYPSFKKLNPFTNIKLFLAVVLSIAIQLLVIYSPLMQGIFGTVALSVADWVMILSVSLFGFIGMELSKLFLWLIVKNKQKMVVKTQAPSSDVELKSDAVLGSRISSSVVKSVVTKTSAVHKSAKNSKGVHE